MNYYAYQWMLPNDIKVCCNGSKTWYHDTKTNERLTYYEVIWMLNQNNHPNDCCQYIYYRIGCGDRRCNKPTQHIYCDKHYQVIERTKKFIENIHLLTNDELEKFMCV